MWDAIGVSASVLCLVHCVLTPIVLSSAPVFSQFLPGDAQVHRVFIVLVVLIGLLAFVSGYRKHRKAVVFLPMAAGVWAIALGAFGGSFMSSFAEKCITVLGSTAYHYGAWIESNVLQILRFVHFGRCRSS